MKLSLELQQTPVDFELIEALKEAHRILQTARIACASGAMQPWRVLQHAQDIIQQELDDLAAPIFVDEEL